MDRKYASRTHCILDNYVMIHSGVSTSINHPIFIAHLRLLWFNHQSNSITHHQENGQGPHFPYFCYSKVAKTMRGSLFALFCESMFNQDFLFTTVFNIHSQPFATTHIYKQVVVHLQKCLLETCWSLLGCWKHAGKDLNGCPASFEKASRAIVAFVVPYYKADTYNLV